MSNPAELIVKKFGGAPKLAEALGIDVSRVYRWTYPKNKSGGTNGIIPSSHQNEILKIAKQRGLPVTPADFFKGANP